MNHGRVLKRLGKDYEQMLKTGKVFTSFLRNGKYVVQVHYTKDFMLLIEMDNQYPFSSPNILINDIHFCDYIHNRMSLLNGLTTRLNIPCPCCYNIMNTWSPGYYLYNIFEEFENIIKQINTYQKLNYIYKYMNNKYINNENIEIIRLIYNYLE